MNSALWTPAIAEVVLISYRDVKSGTNVTNPVPHLPMPSQYVSVVLVFGGLALIPEKYSRLTTLMGWGFVVATALNVFTPGNTVAQTNIGTTPTVTGTTAGPNNTSSTSSSPSFVSRLGTAIKNTLKVDLIP